MAKVDKRVARSDIYVTGLRTKNEKNKSGWSFDRKQPANADDKVLIHKGETYYAWSLFGDAKERISLTYPKRQQLTNSDFKCSVYDIEDRISALNSADFYTDEDAEGLSNERDEIVSDINQLAEEQEEKRSNMPEGLQEVGSGEMLQNRYDSLQEWASNLENVDLDYTADEDLTEEERQEAKEAFLDDAVQEIQEFTYDGE